jgi:hypothetical protein
MAFAGLVLIGFVVLAFWKADKTEAIEQPDNWPPDSPGGNA